jgi:fucose permease
MSYNRKAVFAAACVAMFIFGIVMSILGALLPSVIEQFGLDKAMAGSLFPLMTIGMLLGSLLFGPIVDRYGYKGLLIVCSGLVLIGLEMIGHAGALSTLRIAMFLIGLGGGVINGASNALVADIYVEERGARLSLLGVFFGISAFSIPFLLGLLMDAFGYARLAMVVGGCVAIPILFFLLIRFPEPKQKQGFPLKEGARLIKEAPLLLFGLMLFFESGMEMTMGGWSATFFKEALAIESSRAVIYLSFFWLALMAARLILPRLLKGCQAGRLLVSFISIAFLGTLLLLSARSAGLALAGLMMVGFGFAAVYPIVLGFVGDRYPALSGTAFSMVFVMALTGGSLMPWISGLLGKAHGLRMALAIVPAGMVLMTVVFMIVSGSIPEKNKE